MSDQEKDLHNPIARAGHPDFQKDLSADEEKRVDEKGRPVVLGLPWSAAKTGLYLSVFVTQGKPVLDRQSWGASLEVPSDLARDLLKQKYLVEWIAATAEESLRGSRL